jgi:hypothetical protein
MKKLKTKLPDIFAENAELPVLDLVGERLITCDGYFCSDKQILHCKDDNFLEISGSATAKIAITDGKNIVYVKDDASVEIQISNHSTPTIILSGKSQAKIVCLSGSESRIQLYDNAQVEIELYERAKSNVKCMNISKLTAKVESIGRSNFEVWAEASADLKITKGKHYLTALTAKKVSVEIDSVGLSHLDAYIYQETRLNARVLNNASIRLATNHTSKVEIELDPLAKAEIHAAHQSLVTIKSPVPNNIKTVLLNDAAIVTINGEEEVSA